MAITLNGSTGITTDIDGDESLTLNRDTSDGDIITLQKDNSTVGSIGTNSSRTYVGSGSGQSGIKFNTNAIVPVAGADGVNSDNTFNLGVSSARFKDLYLSGGVYVGGTGSANYLDDYEEGTWTPAFNVVSGSATYTTQVGNYVKVGRKVTATFWIVVNVSSSLVSTHITGLPFTGNNTNYAGVSFSSYEAGAFSGRSNLLGLVAGGTTIQLRGTTSATSAPTVFSASITNGTTLAGSITYFTT